MGTKIVVSAQGDGGTELYISGARTSDNEKSEAKMAGLTCNSYEVRKQF